MKTMGSPSRRQKVVFVTGPFVGGERAVDTLTQMTQPAEGRSEHELQQQSSVLLSQIINGRVNHKTSAIKPSSFNFKLK